MGICITSDLPLQGSLLARLERTHLLREPVPHPFAHLVVKDVRVVLPEARPRDEELRRGQSAHQLLSTRRELGCTHLAVIVESLGHRAREKLGERAILYRLQ